MYTYIYIYIYIYVIIRKTDLSKKEAKRLLSMIGKVSLLCD